MNTLIEYSQIRTHLPGFQSFFSFFLHYFLLAKLATSSIRVNSGSKKYVQIILILKGLHWLPIRKRIGFKILPLTFKCMEGCASLYLRELLVKQANTRTLRSNTKNLLQIPHTNLKRFGGRVFCAYAPRLWNELPDIIKTADSVQNFKIKVTVAYLIF